MVRPTQRQIYIYYNFLAMAPWGWLNHPQRPVGGDWSHPLALGGGLTTTKRNFFFFFFFGFGYWMKMNDLDLQLEKIWDPL